MIALWLLVPAAVLFLGVRMIQSDADQAYWKDVYPLERDRKAQEARQ